MLPGHAQHAAGPRRRIVKGTHNPRLGESIVVLDEKEIHHEPDHLTRSEMFTGGLIRKFGKLADQLLKNCAHLGITDGSGVEVDGGELFGNEIKKPGLREFIDLGMKLKALKNITHRRRESLHISPKIFPDMILIAHEHFQIQGRGIVEKLIGFA